MYMRQLYLTLLFSIIAANTFAQVQKHCITDDVYQQMVQSNPAIAQQQEKFNADAKKQAAPIKQKAGTVRIVPVVFHVFHTAGPENITDAQIFDAIDILNKNFRRLNDNAVDTRNEFIGIAADMEIEFRLARKAPNGNCTNGIVRIFDNETDNGSDSIKHKSIWPADKYLNIWVVNNISHPTFGKLGTGAYAQYPWIPRPETDGIVIMASQLGSIGLGNKNVANALTHEAGHWLGCYHTFENGCTGGDMVDDTPPCNNNRYATINCDFSLNTCNNDSPDLPDQVENYMDYAISTCQNMFTVGQKARMDAALANWRTLLTTTQNLIATGTNQTTTPANCAPVASFIITDNTNMPLQNVCVGNAIQFTDVSYNYNGTITYQWSFEGGTPGTSNQQNPSVLYQTEGQYDVTLIVSNAFGSDTIVFKDYIKVLPQTAPAKAPFVQDFEEADFTAGGWYTTSNGYKKFTVFDVGAGTVIPNNPHTLFVENDLSASGSVFNLYSPAYDISTIPGAVLSFYYAFAPRPVGANYTEDLLAVSYSTDCGKSWLDAYRQKGTTISTIGNGTAAPFVPSGATEWKQLTIPVSKVISSPASQNVLFKIQFVSNGGNNFFLDAINIGFPASVQNSFYNNTANFNVYPNPTNGQTQISLSLPASSAITLTVTDIMGKEIAVLANGNFISGQHQFNFDAANLPVGVYVVKLLAGGNTYYKKIIYQQ
jgi:PKD repeat protein